MNTHTHTAQGYLLVDKLVRTIESWLQTTTIPEYGYNKPAINQRIVQALASRLVTPFLRKRIEGYCDGGIDVNEVLPHKLLCGEFKIYIETGKILPSYKLYIINIGKYLALWFLTLGCFTRSQFGREKGLGPATLIYGVPEADLNANGNTQRFEKFCDKGKLEVLSKATTFVVHVLRSDKKSSSPRFKYAHFPLLALFSANRLNMLESYLFLQQHFHTFFYFFYLIFKCPIACILWRDFADHAVMVAMNDKKLIEANIITNSIWLEQYLWMTDLSNRNFQTYMALYSVNFTSLKFKNDPVIADHPGIKHLRVDLIWIWDTYFEKVLKQDGVFCKTQISPPILWYLPEEYGVRSKSKLLRICIFDVSPMTKERMLGLGMTGSYYSPQTVRSFLDDIMAAADKIKCRLNCEIEIVLKHKRKPSPMHDVSYFNYVNELSRSNQQLQIVAEDVNVFTLIAESDLAVVIPFSSPGYIAKYLNVPAIFYDSTSEILVENENNCPIPFAAGKEQLIYEMTKVVVNVNSFEK